MIITSLLVAVSTTTGLPLDSLYNSFLPIFISVISVYIVVFKNYIGKNIASNQDLLSPDMAELEKAARIQSVPSAELLGPAYSQAKRY
jgi:hypothetical protein